MEVERSHEVSAAVADAAYVASTDVADTIRDAIEAHEESDSPDPAVGRLLEEASVQAEQAVGRVGWLKRWIQRLRGAGR
jgi:hypothetical protein